MRFSTKQDGLDILGCISHLDQCHIGHGSNMGCNNYIIKLYKGLDKSGGSVGTHQSHSLLSVHFAAS